MTAIPHSRRLSRLVLAVLAACLTPALALADQPWGDDKMCFRLILQPTVVTPDVDRDLTACLINEGAAGELLQGARDDDHFLLRIPVGDGAGDLVAAADAPAVGCADVAPGWSCVVEAIEPDAVVLRLEPDTAVLPVAARDASCFTVTGLHVNATEGLAFASFEALVDRQRADKALMPLVEIFKGLGGVIHHDDLAGVVADQHHVKTTLFSELTDAATDAQIPDNITILYAEDAGTVDGKHAVELEESAEIDADVAAHAALPAVHHGRYADAEARLAQRMGTEVAPGRYEVHSRVLWDAGFMQGCNPTAESNGIMYNESLTDDFGRLCYGVDRHTVLGPLRTGNYGVPPPQPGATRQVRLFALYGHQWMCDGTPTIRVGDVEFAFPAIHGFWGDIAAGWSQYVDESSYGHLNHATLYMYLKDYAWSGSHCGSAPGSVRGSVYRVEAHFYDYFPDGQ